MKEKSRLKKPNKNVRHHVTGRTRSREILKDLDKVDQHLVENDPTAIRVGPQPGPQTDFLTTPADICIFGGSAGGGKTVGLLLEMLRHWDNPYFGAVIFRKNSTQVRIQGGLWDESLRIYGPLGARPRAANLEWIFPKGAKVKFAHLEHENSVLDWQGSQIPVIGFDELTHFSRNQFFYMLSRNRSAIAGFPGYIRCTTNPDADSWVRELIDWWIDDDGFAIPKRSGVLRWFIVLDDRMHWASSPEELKSQFHYLGDTVLPKSLTFIPSKIYDNKILLEKDPAYLANLMALSRVDRERLLGGNWNIRPSAGMLFQSAWFPVIETLPSGWRAVIRFWDRAATTPTAQNPDPDWTRGLLLYAYPNGSFVVADLKSIRATPGQVEQFIKNVASHDGYYVRVMSQQDPGSAGVTEGEKFVQMLAGFDVRLMTTSKDKLTRAKPVSAQAEAGNIRVMKAPWNKEFFAELENFPDGKHDDIVDVLSGAFNEISGGISLADLC